MLRRVSHSALALFATIAAPALALAQHGGEESVEAFATAKQGVASAVTALLVFAIVFAVLGVKVWPTIVRALDERANKIKDEIESAEMARKQAKEALDQYQKNLADARGEAQKMIEATRAQQASLANELKAKAEVELAAMRENATRDIENAKRAAIAEIHIHCSQMATMMASKILKRQITSGDQQQLIEDSLAQLQGSRN